MNHSFLTICLALIAFAVSASDTPERMVIHEWGTFTSLQNFDGKELGGINIDDEVLPKFVKTLNPHLIRRFDGNKGFNYAHPDVTMRLETPVVYFHPPKSMKLPHTLDLSVSFKCGWLTQFYPNAAATAPGLKSTQIDRIGPITSATVGTLEWKGLKIGVDTQVPETDSKVWTAPRNVAAATVANAAGEAEKYLFYRGVGNLAAPLKVTRIAESKYMSIEAQLIDKPTQESINARESTFEPRRNKNINKLWYAHFKPDGSSAFRELRPETYFAICTGSSCPGNCMFSTPAAFSPGEYGMENLAALKKLMRAGLIADGLFADEADALLNTWEVSYFKNPGLRLFFLVPRVWTDHVLPLTVSEPAEIVRTMVGRIELVSPEHVAALDALSNPELFKTDLPGAFRTEAAVQQAYAQIKVLGRFVTPLLADRLRTNPSPSLKWIANTFTTPSYKIEPQK